MTVSITTFADYACAVVRVERSGSNWRLGTVSCEQNRWLFYRSSADLVVIDNPRTEMTGLFGFSQDHSCVRRADGFSIIGGGRGRYPAGHQPLLPGY